MTTRFVFFAVALTCTATADGAEDWPQLKYDSRHSGNVVDRTVTTPLGLVGAVPLTDAVFTSPAVVDGRIFIVDGAGVAFCIDAKTLQVVWKVVTDGGPLNCNNVSSPVVTDGKVHFGTMAGTYYVLDARDGTVVRKIRCESPIFSCPVVVDDTVYFATLGSRVFALSADGKVRWTWDYVREILKYDGDRWDGQAWAKHKQGRVTWRDQFLCSRDIAAHGKTLVLPTGGTIIWLRDEGDHATFLAAYHAPRESPATLGLSLDDAGTVYRQWFRRDNGGRVEMLRLADGKVDATFVAGTESSYLGSASLSFSSVSVRGRDVYRCRPEEGFGLCRHAPGEPTQQMGAYPSIAPPVLVGDKAVVGGLDGRLHVVPLSGDSDAWSFATAPGRPITAAAAVCDGRIYFGCEDGYLYVLGPDGNTPLPNQDLKLDQIRSPLTGPSTDEQFDWFTHFANQANTNVTPQQVEPPFKINWIRRLEGTVKHVSVFGGGRMYTHTAEGQILAVEQETGRLLWRRFFPGVHVSFTTPIYFQGKLLLPQAGLKQSRLRCLDAATGRVIWETPFTGSPSWNRQTPPQVHDGLVFYPFSSGKYTPRTWLFEHQSTFGFPEDQKPLVKAWDLNTGEEVWSLDFSQHGAGGDDAGMCLMDGTLYYSCYFGAKQPSGVTAAIEPKTGKVLWKTTRHAVHAGCTVSGKDGRLYLGGYNPVEGNINRVWCLDARDGSLVWQSDPIHRAIHVITVADDFLFTHAQYRNGYQLSKDTGAKLRELTHGYRCTRFTMAGGFLLGPNMDVYDTSRQNRLISSGPAVDVLLCVGSQVSNGRIFSTTNGSGLQLSVLCGQQAERFERPWR